MLDNRTTDWLVDNYVLQKPNHRSAPHLPPFIGPPGTEYPAVAKVLRTWRDGAIHVTGWKWIEHVWWLQVYVYIYIQTQHINGTPYIYICSFVISHILYILYVVPRNRYPRSYVTYEFMWDVYVLCGCTSIYVLVYIIMYIYKYVYSYCILYS